MLWWSTALGVLDWSVASASESMGNAMETFYLKRAQQLCENSSASIGQGQLNLFQLNLLVLGSSNTEDNREVLTHTPLRALLEPPQVDLVVFKLNKRALLSVLISTLSLAYSVFTVSNASVR